MTAYIIRRLLLVIPTLIGISFLVFMLIALSPGGIGAAVRAQAGAQSTSSLGLQEAYLEDRYGLDDPVIVQYLRWLARISPMKFGTPDQIDPTGAVVRAPKTLDLPPLAGLWYAEGAVPGDLAPPDDIEIGETDEEKNLTYRAAANEYARERIAYIGASVEVEQALRSYAIANGMRHALEADNDLKLDVFKREGFDPAFPEYAEIVSAGTLSLEALQRARQSRAHLQAVFDARPYPRATWTILGIPLRLGPVHLATPDFGVSFSTSRPVVDLLAERLPVTLLLNLVAFPIIYVIAVPMGMLAAIRQGTWIDTLGGALVVALWSVPVVWAGVLALVFLASNQNLGLFPVSGLQDPDSSAMTILPFFNGEGVWQRGAVLDVFWHVALPVSCLVYTGFAILAKQTRAAMLDNFNADYVRTAKAKGVASRDIVFRHVFRNSLLPLITIFATLFPAMLSGSVVVESIFSIDGMGKLVLESINQRDRELLLANVLLVGGVNLLGLLIADILYALADPRISYE